ncbi:hypothetical protein RhiLY_08754 [Ceratobasidium sp. AG-Ba]|nr:hypothetical protein RhiLY_08754 [Ceratobasidium sp. AG-Ba]
MFNKFAIATATALIGISSMLMGVAALPANATEIAARSINPAGTHTGQSVIRLTHNLHYDTDQIGLGACGWTNSNTEWVAAISHELFDNWPGYTGSNPNKNPVCTTPHTADVTYKGKTIRVGIVDRCGGCALWDLDLSPSAFQQLAPLSAGRLSGATWHFN